MLASLLVHEQSIPSASTAADKEQLVTAFSVHQQGGRSVFDLKEGLTLTAPAVVDVFTRCGKWIASKSFGGLVLTFTANAGGNLTYTVQQHPITNAHGGDLFCAEVMGLLYA
jgi:hypothetical protein